MNRSSAIEVMYSYLLHLSTKISSVFCYQLKDAYESTIPQQTRSLHEVNIFSNINITVSFVLTLIRVYTTVWMVKIKMATQDHYYDTFKNIL